MIEPTSASESENQERRIEAIAEEYLAMLQAGRHPNQAALLAAHADITKELQRRLALVERLFRATRVRPLPADRAQHLKCPHCGNRIQLVEPSPRTQRSSELFPKRVFQRGLRRKDLGDSATHSVSLKPKTTVAESAHSG